MDFLRNRQRSSSVSATSPSPPVQPTNDDIEAVIQMATSSRPSPDGRTSIHKDTRTQLFVGNLPYRVRWQDLKDLFRKAGTVLRADVSLGPDNRSRGYGTVLLATAEDAGRAVDMFNGYPWQTRILEVRPDRLPPDFDNPLSSLPNPPLSAFTPSPLTSLYGMPSHSSAPSMSISDDLDYGSLIGHDFSSTHPSSSRSLFVGNLPFHCQWQDLKDLFRQAGTIMRADVALGPDGRSRGFGTVVFATEHDAENAVKIFNGFEYNGRSLKVHFDKFSQASQPSTTPASPLNPTLQAAAAQSEGPSLMPPISSQPKGIILPVGYTFGPPSGPGSPSDELNYPFMFAKIQQQHQQKPQQPQQQQLPPHIGRFNTSPKLDHNVDKLASNLASTRLSSSVPPPLNLPSLGSTSSNTDMSKAFSQATSRTSTNTPSSASPRTSRYHNLQAQSQVNSQHPHHPGPISLPPPSLVTFPLPSPHTPQQLRMPHGLSLSPLHHPAMAPPMNHPSSQAQMVPMTPHGLPPITPSMPPFTFLPPNQSQNQQSTGPAAFTPGQPYPPPLTLSLGLASQPSSPLHGPRMNSTHARQMMGSAFSPGAAMSPGTLWGGEPNPFINPAVGAPVRPHLGNIGVPGHMQMPTQTMHGGFYYGPLSSPGSVTFQEPKGYFDQVYVTADPNFTSGLGRSALESEIFKDRDGWNRGHEKDTKDITQDHKPSKGDEDKNFLGEKQAAETAWSSPSDVTEGSESEFGRRGDGEGDEGGLGSNVTSWHGSELGNDDDDDLGDNQDMASTRRARESLPEKEKHVGVMVERDVSTISRTHSMSAARKPSTFMLRAGSDPSVSGVEGGELKSERAESLSLESRDP